MRFITAFVEQSKAFINIVVEKAKVKPAWGIAFVLSVIYCIRFVRVSYGAYDPGLLFGFCVCGSPETPKETIGCSSSPANSHILAFGIDLVMTVFVVIFWCKDRSEKKENTIYIANGFIILAHGILHWYLQQQSNPFGLPIINCYSDLDDKTESFGYIIFGAFSFILGLIVLGFGVGFNKKTIGGSVVFAAFVVFLTKNTDGDLVLPGLFVVVHPLCCFTGLFSDVKNFQNPFIGQLFAVCTLVGISELSVCTSFFKAIGGNLWYDVTLHAAVLASLPYFSGPEVRAGHVYRRVR